MARPGALGNDRGLYGACRVAGPAEASSGRPRSARATRRRSSPVAAHSCCRGSAKTRSSTAFDVESGKQVWQQRYRAAYQVNPAAESHGKGPKSTPAIGGGRVFTLGINGTLSAFDAGTGKPLWRKPFDA